MVHLCFWCATPLVTHDKKGRVRRVMVFSQPDKPDIWLHFGCYQDAVRDHGREGVEQQLRLISAEEILRQCYRESYQEA